MALSDYLASGRCERSTYDVLVKTVLVNGDDILFRAPRDFLPFFYKRTKEVGLVQSLGKNYVSSFFALINSKMFVLKEDVMVERSYVNLKLVLGSSLKAGVSQAMPTQIGSDLSRMVSLCPQARGLIPLAFSRWSRDWKGWFQPNWYLPAHLGGYGVDESFSPRPLHEIVTRSQRLMAAKFISDPKLALYRRKSVPINLKPFVGFTSAWKMVPVELATEDELSMVDISDDWLVRAAFAHQAMGLGDPKRKVQDSVFYSKFSRNSRLRPMSLSGLDRWKNVIFFSSALPVCGPLAALRVDQADFQRKKRLRHLAKYEVDDFTGSQGISPFSLSSSAPRMKEIFGSISFRRPIP